MAGLVFNTCCGCIELRSGCLIIGYLQLISEVIAILAVAFLGLAGGLLASVDIKDESGKVNEDFTTVTNAGGTVVYVVCIILLLILVIGLAFTIVLLVGVHQEKRGHINAYLIYSYVFFGISILLFFVSFAGKVTVSSVISGILSLLLTLYFILVVRSYYYKMNEAPKGGVIYSAP